MFPIWTADVENKRDDGVATGIDERFAAQVGLLNLEYKIRLFLATLLKEIVIVGARETKCKFMYNDSY